MKVYDNGVYREMTPKELEDYNNILIPAQETVEDLLEKRLSNVEKTNDTQFELIDVTLMATDEMYCMLEPILELVPQALASERTVSKMIDMYVAMIIRGLKTIEEVPTRYREEVKKVLAQLEK